MRLRHWCRWLGLCLWTAQAWLAQAAVEVNHAPAHDLITIKGIGPATSDKIVQARLSAPFRDWTDFIQRVKGVGPAKATQMSAQGLRVNGQPFAVDVPANGTLPSASTGQAAVVAASRTSSAVGGIRSTPTAPAHTPTPSQPPSGGVIEWRPMVPRPLEKAH